MAKINGAVRAAARAAGHLTASECCLTDLGCQPPRYDAPPDTRRQWQAANQPAWNACDFGNQQFRIAPFQPNS